MGYLVLLVAGMLIVVIDGQLLMRDGAACLGGGSADPRRGRRLVQVIGVVFDLAMSGVVLLVVAQWPGVGLAPTSLVPKLGLLLLLTALAHVLAMVVLFRITVPAGPGSLPADPPAARDASAG